MKTLAVFTAPVDAQLLAARLAGSGIQAFVRDEIVGNLMATPAIGGIRIDVADEEYEKATALMDAGPENETLA